MNEFMRKLLIVVDYQVDFVIGSLGFSDAVQLEGPICDKIIEFENNGDDVVFTLDTHSENYLETEEGRYLPIEHCIAGQIGHELYGEVRNLAHNHPQFCKDTFPSKELLQFLLDKEYDEVLLAGVVTNICVISNAIIAKAALSNAHIVVDHRLVASNDRELEKECFNVMKSLQIEVI